MDIVSSDAGFRFTAACGSLQSYVPATSPVGQIVPGAHVVGQHILSGTYTSNAASSCYSERTTSFQGTSAAIIANDFVSAAGQQVVTISPSDTGFYANANCGTWVHV